MQAGRLTRGALLLLALGGVPALAAQAPSTRRALLALEDGWATALVKRDTAYFRRTLAPGFVYSEDAKTFTRDQVLHDLVSPGEPVTEAHNEEMVVHDFGATAVVTGWLVVNRHRYRFTDTWVRSAGRWRIVAAHDYLVP